jgi:HAE1 family hydrophobic/amphiphilic exporter-1
MIGWMVRRPAVVLSACAALLAAGGIAFSRLALATKTTVEYPRLQISASWPGAAPEIVEMYVTSRIESAVQGVRDVRRVSSSSQDGLSSVTATLERTARVQLVRLAILERLEMLRADSAFPRGVSKPRVSNYVPDELQEAPLVRITMTGPYTAAALQKAMRDIVMPRLAAVQGVAGISQPMGGTELAVALTYDAQRLRQLGIPPDLLAGAIQSARIVQSLGAESMGASVRNIVLRDEPHAIEDLAALPIRTPQGRVFRLGDLSTVRTEEDSRGAFYRIDGNPALGVTVSREPGADAIRTAATVRATVAALGSQLPAGVRLKVANDESIRLKNELRDLTKRGAIAFGAVLLVLGVLLLDVRAVALVMGSTAVAIAGTALSLYVLRIPANLLTLAGLGMGIGILVQNALVVAERLRVAPPTVEGRIATTRAIAPAVMGATLTTAVVLFPFLYLQGNARAAFRPFASAFGLALFWSVIAAVTVVPALAGRHVFRRLRWRWGARQYARTVGWLLRLRWAVLPFTLAVLVALAWVFQKKVPKYSWGGGYGQQRTTLTASLGFPRGSDPELLDRGMREFEALVVGRPEVEQVVTSGNVWNASMTITFTEDGAFTAVPLELEELLTQRAVFIGGANVSVRGQGPGFYAGFGGGTSATFRIRILGYSYRGVEQVALDLKSRLEGITRVRDVNINAASTFGGQKNYKVTLEPDRDALARFGITAAQFSTAVAREMRSAAAQTLLEIGGEEVPVSVHAIGARERTLSELRDALVANPQRAPARISDLAAVSEREALYNIQREDQQYIRILSYDFRGPSRLAQRSHDAFMKSVTVPPGYSVTEATYSWGGEDASSKGLWLVFAIGITLVILSVALVFDSAWAAAMVLLSLPLALAGVVVAFWYAGAAFTREAAVGVILVVGLAVNQVILLVDAGLARRRRRDAAHVRRSLDAADAVRAAVDRARMIIVVTLATLASLLPLAIGTKATSLFGAIALATAGGTVAGTLGTLFIMPVLVFGHRGSVRKRRLRQLLRHMKSNLPSPFRHLRARQSE